MLALVGILAAGCAGPAQGIADRIRAANSPIVREVHISPANPFGGKPDEVKVYIDPKATEADALALWCDVMLPAGATDMPAGTIDVWRGQPGTGQRALHDPVCPGDASPALSPGVAP
jgi:hypothetical protein